MNDMRTCDLCGRSEPVTEMDVMLNPSIAVGYPIICGTDCFMLPMLSMPAYHKINSIRRNDDEYVWPPRRV